MSICFWRGRPKNILQVHLGAAERLLTFHVARKVFSVDRKEQLRGHRSGHD